MKAISFSICSVILRLFLIRYSRLNNLIIKGVPEGRFQNVELMVRSLLFDVFGLDDVPIERVHRLGNFNSNRSRPIIVRFLNYSDRERVWRNKKLLRGSKFFLEEDFCQNTRSIRRKLLPVMLEASRKGHESYLDKDNVVIDGKPYTIDTVKSLPKEIRDGSRWRNDQVSFFGELCPASNFHKAEFTHDGNRFANSEQALFYKQAMKFGDEETAELILQESDPRKVKKLSKTTKNVINQEWNESIEELVTPILFDKFDQNKDLLDWLKSTGTRRLVEAAGPSDLVWGNGHKLQSYRVHDTASWTGDNKQGQMLMMVRKILCPELFQKVTSTAEDVMNTEAPDNIFSTQAFTISQNHEERTPQSSQSQN